MNQGQLQRQLALIKQQLETTVQAKNNEIIELRHALNRAEIKVRSLDEKNQFLESEYRALNQKYKELELYSRERSHALTLKNKKIVDLQDQVESVANQKAKEMQQQIDKLMEVIRSQEEQMSIYLGDHQQYVGQFEKMAHHFRAVEVQKELLSQYTGQLQKQIEEVETQNSSLQGWIVQAHDQLKAQNQQSGDLLSQVQYMMDKRVEQ